MIFRELSNAAFRFSLRRPGAEIMGGAFNPPPPSRRWKIQRPSRARVNYAAKILFGRRKYDHVSDLLERLGWLGAEDMTTYHTVCLTHKVRRCGEPEQLAAGLTTVAKARAPERTGFRTKSGMIKGKRTLSKGTLNQKSKVKSPKIRRVKGRNGKKSTVKK